MYLKKKSPNSGQAAPSCRHVININAAKPDHARISIYSSKHVLKYLIACLFVLTASFSYSQSTQRPSDLQNVIPPSPNASSLGKYADWPVSLYTGIPSIDIPLYTLKGRTTSVPISVSYHSSGIKVGEVASSVGLGWALNGGGVITRSVRGLPDEAGGVGYFDVRKLYTNPGDLSSATTVPSMDSLTTAAVANGLSDSEPDLYMFNALGRSFKFYFSGNGTIITQPYSKIIIKTNYQDSTWRVTMDDGTKLIFGGGSAVEITASTRSMIKNSDMPSFISTWYLKSITTPAGEVIRFNYEKSVINQDAGVFQVDYLYQTTLASSSCATSPNKQPYHYVETQAVDMLNLSSIESDLGKVLFINDTTGRIDLPGGKYLKEIDVFSKTANKYIQKFKFSYSYSQAGSSLAYTSQNSNQSKYRLKLNFIQETPIDNSSPKTWTFSYNPLLLPSRQSYAQDHWGYFNGAVNNSTFLPVSTGFENPGVYTSGVRDADSTSMAAEMLTKITYPTGGYSTFNFEPNTIATTKDYQTSSSANLNLYLTANQNPYNNTISQTFTITQGQYVTLAINASFSSSITNDYGPSTNFATVSIINSSQIAVCSVPISNSKLTGGRFTSSQYVSLLAGTYTFKISSISSSGDFVSSSDFVSIQGNFSYLQSTGTRAFNQPVGGLRVKSIIDYAGSGSPVQRNFKYENPNIPSFDPVNDYLTSVTDNTYDCAGTCTSAPVSGGAGGGGGGSGGGGGGGGGGVDQLGCITVYSIYYNSDGSIRSEGSEQRCGYDPQTYNKPLVTDTVMYTSANTGSVLNNDGESTTDEETLINKVAEQRESNDRQEVPQNGFPGMLISSYVYKARSSNLKWELGTIQGGTVGYGKVTTSYGANGGNGYTVSYFSQANDLNVSESKVLPFLPVVPLDWRKGLLLNETIYTSANVPLRKITNDYLFTNQQSIKTYKAANSFNILSSCFTFNHLSELVTKSYFNVITEQVQKTRSTLVNYFNNGLDSNYVVTNFFYDTPANLQPTRSESLNSQGLNIKTLSRTALEKTAINSSIPLSATASAAIDTMVSRNMITNVIESETYNNASLVDKTITNFALCSNNVLPQEIKTQDGGNPIQSRLLLNNYDTYGNLLEQQKTAGPVNNYIYDYKSNYPVASVTNGSLANIAYTGFESNGTGNWTIGSAQRDSVTTAFTGTKSYPISNGGISKSGLSAATTYVVSYWIKNTTPTTPLTVSGTPVSGYPIKGPTNKGWTYYEHRVSGITTITLAGTGNIDDVKLYPVNAQMSTYTYDPLVGPTSSTDARGMTSYYEYDGFQRLMNIKDQKGNILKNFNYNYVSTSATWADTGTPECVQGSNGNTGEQRVQQTDTNPYSPTYGAHQWRSISMTSPSCPVTVTAPATVYLRMTVGSTSTSNGLTYNTYVFNSYSDEACTMAYNVPSALTVNYRYVTSRTYADGRTPNPEVTTTNSTVTIAAGAHQATGGSIPVSGCFGINEKQICYSTVVTLQPGTGYVVDQGD
jgi:YD repeat-containing protein